MKAEDIYDKALAEYPIKEKLNEKAVGTYDANYPRRKAFIAGAEWMQAQVEEWLRKSGRGQMMGSLNRFLDNKVDVSK